MDLSLSRDTIPDGNVPVNVFAIHPRGAFTGFQLHPFYVQRHSKGGILGVH